MTTAAEILTKGAAHLQDRATTYDKPAGERSMTATVAAFKAVAGITLTEEQGWLFMVLLKAVRSQQGGHRADNYEDGAAYFALAGETAAIERMTPQEVSAKLQEIVAARPVRAEELQADEQGPACSCPGVMYQFLQDKEARHICTEKPADDGWIEWAGGEQAPVPPDSHAVVLYRDGAKALTKAPQWLAWTHSKDAKDVNDIVAYRLAKEQS